MGSAATLLAIALLGAVGIASASVACHDYQAPLVKLGSVEGLVSAGRVALAGSWAYVIERPTGLVVIDCRQPSAPVIAGRLTLPGRAQDLVVTGGQLLLALFSPGGVAAYDLAEPDAPAYLGTRNGLGNKYNIAADGSLICAGGDSLHVLATTVGGPPAVVGRLALASGSLDVDGTKACLYQLGGVVLVDLQNPANPSVLGSCGSSFSEDDYAWEEDGFVQLCGSVVAISYDWSSIYEPYGGEGFRVIDFSNPAAPVSVLDREMYYHGRLVTVGDLLYAASSYFGWLRVFDLANPADVHLEFEQHLVWSNLDLAIADGLACVLSASGATMFSMPGQVVERPVLGQVSLPAPVDAQIAGAHAYVADATQGLCVLDVSAPTAPGVVACIPVADAADRVDVAPGRLYLIGHRGNGASRVCWLSVYSRSNPASPSLLGSVDLPERLPTDLEARGRFLWTAGDSGLTVWDCRDGAAPVRARVWKLPVFTLAISGDHLYAAGRDTLRVFAFTDSMDVVRLANSPGPGDRVAASRGRVCLAHGNYYGGYIYGVDVSDPAMPARGQPVHMMGVGKHLVLGSYAVIAGVAGSIYSGGPTGVHLVDLEDPLAPEYVGPLAWSYDDVALAAGPDFVMTLSRTDARVGLAPVPCDAAVPVFLASFTARREDHAVVLDWAVAGEVDGSDFRLLGSDGLHQWEVPVEAVAAAAFTARDGSERALAGGALAYRLLIREGGVWAQLAEASVPAADLPAACRLLEAFPNPFNPRLQLRLAIDRPRDVEVGVYDLAGRLVARVHRGPLAAGVHTLAWDGARGDGRPAGAGAYVIRLSWEGGTSARRVALVR